MPFPEAIRAWKFHASPPFEICLLALQGCVLREVQYRPGNLGRLIAHAPSAVGENSPKTTLQQMLSETRLPLVGAVAHDIDFEGPPEAEESDAQLAQKHS